MNNKKLKKDDYNSRINSNFRPMNNLSFRFMTGIFSIRDIKTPPMRKIEKAEIKKGETVLDYGCGPGSFTMAAAEKVGPEGKIYAADIHPLAIKTVRKKISKMKAANIQTIMVQKKTGLPENSTDIVLLFDIIHAFKDMTPFVEEFLKILKPGGRIAVDDHHMTEHSIINSMTASGRLRHIKTSGSVVLFQGMVS